MCQFIESIKLQDGDFFRLDFHQERMNRAFRDFFPGQEIPQLKEHLAKTPFPTSGLLKCRVLYGSEIHSTEFVPYVRREITSLKIVETTQDSLPYKTNNRSGFDTAFALRGECDDVLLVKNGLLTDTSYSNIALWNGKNWFTPRVPLLYGVNRASLLAEGKIVEKDIAASDLKQYSRIALFNAMVEFGEVVLDVEMVS
ncbi:MAG TPA: aminotransferase class IV [Paludibacter sp.]|nr:aminotransferase class IV [Paludibacter sp.]